MPTITSKTPELVGLQRRLRVHGGWSCALGCRSHFPFCHCKDANADEDQRRTAPSHQPRELKALRAATQNTLELVAVTLSDPFVYSTNKAPCEPGRMDVCMPFVASV